MNDQAILLDYAPSTPRHSGRRLLILFGVFAGLGAVGLFVGYVKVIHQASVCQKCGAIKERRALVTARGALLEYEFVPRSASRRAWNETVKKASGSCHHDWQWLAGTSHVDMLAKIWASQNALRRNFADNRCSEKKFDDERRRILDDLKRETDLYYKNRRTP